MSISRVDRGCPPCTVKRSPWRLFYAAAWGLGMPLVCQQALGLLALVAEIQPARRHLAMVSPSLSLGSPTGKNWLAYVFPSRTALPTTVSGRGHNTILCPWGETAHLSTTMWRGTPCCCGERDRARPKICSCAHKAGGGTRPWYRGNHERRAANGGRHSTHPMRSSDALQLLKYSRTGVYYTAACVHANCS